MTFDAHAWDMAMNRVILRLAPAVVTLVSQGELSFDRATEILQVTGLGGRTEVEEFLTGCLSDVMDYHLDGVVPEAAETGVPQEDPCLEATLETLSDLAFWGLAPAVCKKELSLERAVLLYAISARVHKDKAEEMVTAAMAERMTVELEYGD